MNNVNRPSGYQSIHNSNGETKDMHDKGLCVDYISISVILLPFLAFLFVDT
jgi:hypothetical protein